VIPKNLPTLIIGVLLGVAVTAVSIIVASFNQAGSGSNTVSAQSASIQVADINETTFAAAVAASLDKFTTNATGLNNDGLNHFAGFVDLLHVDGDTVSAHYSLQNAPNPAPSTGSNNAALNDKLDVIIWESQAVGSGQASGSTSTGMPNCPASQGPIVSSGVNSPTVARTAWKAMNASNLALPPAGSAIRLCFYLILPADTPQTAAGGKVSYDLTFTALP
jgi:hypothetical protein